MPPAGYVPFMRCSCSAAVPRVVTLLRRVLARLAPDLASTRREAEALRSEIARMEDRLGEVLTQLDDLVDRLAATAP